jgi:hypothetical protein
MRVRSGLLLGAATVALGMGSASGADLPMAEPVEYVRVCDTYGTGFFYIPGTDTCLRLGGVLRAEYLAMQNLPPGKGGYNKNELAFRARVRGIFDARTSTEYGLLRSFIRYEIDARSGPSTGGDLLNLAYIQFGGLTVGYIDSMFDFKPYPAYSGMLVSDLVNLVAAYTADFGNGFSGTIAVEDNTYRRDRVEGLNGITQAPDGSTQKPIPWFQGGQVIPDVVGNLRVDQAWGDAKLSAASHRLANGNREAWGWAVQAGVQVDLPMLAAKDFVYASAAYADGALSYILSGQEDGFGGVFNPMSGVPQSSFLRQKGSDTLDKTQAWNVNAGFVHYLDPRWRVTFSGSYADIDYAGKVVGLNRKYDPDWAAGQFAGQIIWTPAAGLDIGFEIDYTHFFQAPQNFRSAAGGYTGTPGREHTWGGRVRVERTF